MSIPQTAQSPPFRITRFSHVVLNVTDVARSCEFYENLIGLVVTAADADVAYLRGVEEACHHSLVLRRADDPTAEVLGFRVATEADLDAAKEYFEANALPAAWVDEPHQGRTLRVADSSGVPIEFCVTMPVEQRMVIEHHLHRGAAAARLDHLQVHVPDPAAWVAFHCDLGFRISEYATEDGTPDTQILGAFLARKGDLLDFVGVMNVGPRLHHFAWLVHDASYTLTRVADIASGLGLRDAVEYGPARHGLAPQQFVYIRDPDGHRTELVSQGYLYLDPELEPIPWSLSDPRGVTTWGPMPGQTWFEDASLFRGIETSAPTGPPAWEPEDAVAIR